MLRHSSPGPIRPSAQAARASDGQVRAALPTGRQAGQHRQPDGQQPERGRCALRAGPLRDPRTRRPPGPGRPRHRGRLRRRRAAWPAVPRARAAHRVTVRRRPPRRRPGLAHRVPDPEGEQRPRPGGQQGGEPRAEGRSRAGGRLPVDALGDLVHVLQGDAPAGRGQVDPLQQPSGLELGGPVVGRGRGDHPVRGGGRGVHGAGLRHPEAVAVGPGGGRQQLGQPEHQRAQSLPVEHQAVAVALDLVVAAPEPDEAVPGLLLVGGERDRRVDEQLQRGRPSAPGRRPSARPPRPARSDRRGPTAFRSAPAVARTDPGWCAGRPMASYSGLDCGAGVRRQVDVRHPGGADSRPGAASRSGRRPRAWQPRTRFSSAQPRPMYCSRPERVDRAGRPRASSRKTSMVSAPTREDPGLGVVRAGGQHGAGHRAERTRASSRHCVHGSYAGPPPGLSTAVS